MAKKTKTKAWVKGLIAVAVIAVIGGLGYYGANGEMFQGKLKLDRPGVDRVQMDKVNKFDRVNNLKVDGVDDALLKEVAVDNVAIDKVGDYDTVAIDNVAIDKVDMDYDTVAIDKLAIDKVDMDYDTVAIDKLAIDKVDMDYDTVAIDKLAIDKVGYDVAYSAMDLTVADQDVDLLNVEIDNTDKTGMLVTDLVIYEDGGGLYNYEVFVDGVKIDATVRIETDYLERVGKEVRKITFDLESPYEIEAMDVGTFTVKADVAGGKDSVSHVFDKVVMDGKFELVNMDIDFDSVARDIGKLK